jgi:hypothetical protein
MVERLEREISSGNLHNFKGGQVMRDQISVILKAKIQE